MQKRSIENFHLVVYGKFSKIVTSWTEKFFIFIIKGWFQGRRKRRSSRVFLLRVSHCFGI